MENQNKFHKYRNKTSEHKVNVFHIHSLYRFFHISCKNCVLKTQCKPIKHKREACEIADEAHELLTQCTVGHVSSFASDDFYIQSDKQKSKIERVLQHLSKKYTVKDK